MEKILVILKFFGLLILLFGIGWSIGHLFRLDKVYEEMHIKKKQKI